MEDVARLKHEVDPPMTPRPISITLIVDGVSREFRSLEGASVAVCLTDLERRDVEDGVRLLREEQGARVPLNMPAVDGLRLELVPAEDGEGRFAPPPMFSINRFGELVSKHELQQVHWLRNELKLNPRETRLAEIRRRMSEARIEVLYIEDEDPQQLHELLVKQWPNNISVTEATTRQAAERELRDRSFSLGLIDLRLDTELAGLDIARRYRDRLTTIFFYSALAEYHRSELMVVKPAAIIQKPVRTRQLISMVQQAWPMVLGTSPP